MATVEKGTLTTSKEWWDHLRWTKRAFWKAERRASRTVAVEDAAERAKRRNEPWIFIVGETVIHDGEAAALRVAPLTKVPSVTPGYGAVLTLRERAEAAERRADAADAVPPAIQPRIRQPGGISGATKGDVLSGTFTGAVKFPVRHSPPVICSSGRPPST
jgi:hypothetical protein